jgi:hemoglobin
MSGNTKTLYELIGSDKLAELVEHFYHLVYSHPTLSPFFHNDIEEVKDKQFRFLTQFLGGPNLYSDKYGHPRMRMRHLPHRIDEQAMHAWLACMKEAIQKLNLEPNLADALYNCFPQVARHMVNS